MCDLTGQLKIDMFTGRIYKVASRATERPNREKQGDMFQWIKDQEALEKLHYTSAQELADNIKARCEAS